MNLGRWTGYGRGSTFVSMKSSSSVSRYIGGFQEGVGGVGRGDFRTSGLIYERIVKVDRKGSLVVGNRRRPQCQFRALGSWCSSSQATRCLFVPWADVLMSRINSSAEGNVAQTFAFSRLLSYSRCAGQRFQCDEAKKFPPSAPITRD